MGAKIVKLINEDSSLDSSGYDDKNWDLEQGEERDSSTWDSDDSSSDNDEDDNCTSEYKCTIPNYSDPYIVEKRFVAGSNEYFYDIVKRK